MKYLLKPLDSSYPELWFDTNSLYDLARLGGWDEDVVYVAGNAYHAPMDEVRPSVRVAGAYVRELETEAAAAKAERDTLMAIVDNLLSVDSELSQALPVGMYPRDYLPFDLADRLSEIKGESKS